MNWLTNLITSLASMGWPAVAGIGSILAVLILLFFYIRSSAAKEEARKQMEKERDTYARLAETLSQRKKQYDELMEKMRQDRRPQP